MSGADETLEWLAAELKEAQEQEKMAKAALSAFFARLPPEETTFPPEFNKLLERKEECREAVERAQRRLKNYLDAAADESSGSGDEHDYRMEVVPIHRPPPLVRQRSRTKGDRYQTVGV